MRSYNLTSGDPYRRATYPHLPKHWRVEITPHVPFDPELETHLELNQNWLRMGPSEDLSRYKALTIDRIDYVR